MYHLDKVWFILAFNFSQNNNMVNCIPGWAAKRRFTEILILDIWYWRKLVEVATDNDL